MKCIRCKWETIERSVDLHRRWGDEWYIVRNVPAHVCVECGEEYYDADVLDRIDRMREDSEKSIEWVKVPAMDYTSADKAA